MSSELVGEIFGWVGTVIATYFYLSPYVVYKQVIEEKMKNSDSPGLMLFMSFMNCIMWADFGLNQDKTQVYVANGLGGLITLVWITIYLIYAAGKDIKKAILYNLIFIAAMTLIHFSCFFYFKDALVAKVVMVFNILMYAAPGAKIIEVANTGNYNLLPIFSSLGGLACSLCWLSYGVYINEITMIVPNGLGLFFAVLQVIAYFYYKHKKENKKKDEKLNE